MQYQTLKERHRQERDRQHPNLSLRIHRVLSWLNRAEQADDADGRFIFLWILAAVPVFERLVANERKAQTLTQLRDTLLPRLISGQLRLPEAESLLENAL